MSEYISQFNWIMAVAVFIAYAVNDALYVYYTLHVVNLNPKKSAVSSVMIHALIAFGVLSYVNNPLYIIPLLIGAFCGTYFSLKSFKR